MNNVERLAAVRPLFTTSPFATDFHDVAMADQNKKNDDFVMANMSAEGANENNIGDGEKENDSLVGRGPGTSALPAQPGGFMAKVENSGPFSILAYCLSSISMTVVNKYVVSGTSWNLTFFYLAVQVSFDCAPRFRNGV